MKISLLKLPVGMPLAAAALLVAALYGQFLSNPLVFDDYNFFGRADSSYLEAFKLALRWLPYASFEWTRVLVGPETVWHRVGNLALHVGTVMLLFGFLRQLFEAALPGPSQDNIDVRPLSQAWLAFFGAVIFAFHPASVYAVAYLIQRTTLMATLFTLLMWWLFLAGLTTNRRIFTIGSAIAYLFAAFSKEHAIMAPAVALAMFFLLRKPTRESLRLVLPAFVLYALIAVYVVVLHQAGHLIGVAYEPRGVNMLSQLGARDRGFDPTLAYPLSILTQSFLFFKYLLVWILPNPAWMSVDMVEPFATRLWAWPQIAGFVAFVLYPVLAVRLLLTRGSIGLLGFGLLCPWLMFATELSTVRIQESFVLYRSYLWMGGLFAALPFLFQKVPARHAAVLLSAFVLVLMPATWYRLVTFSHPLLLWHDAARLIKGKEDRPGVERIYHNRGVAAVRASPDLYLHAIEDYSKAIALQPRFSQAYSDRGAAYLGMRKYPESLADFNRALELNPQYARTYLGRGLTLEALNDKQAARRDYEEACRRGLPEGCRRLGLPSAD